MRNCARAGACEFVQDFAEVLPVHIFLTLIGMPRQDHRDVRIFGRQLMRPDGTVTVEQQAYSANDCVWPYLTV